MNSIHTTTMKGFYRVTFTVDILLVHLKCDIHIYHTHTDAHTHTHTSHIFQVCDRHIKWDISTAQTVKMTEKRHTSLCEADFKGSQY